jgi:hypothetical protein
MGFNFLKRLKISTANNLLTVCLVNYIPLRLLLFISDILAAFSPGLQIILIDQKATRGLDSHGI